MDWMLVPCPKSWGWNPSAQHDNIRRQSLWKVIRVMWDNQSGALRNGITALTSSERAGLPSLLSTMWHTPSPQPIIQKMALPSIWPCWHPDLTLAVSRTVKNKFLFLTNHPVCDTLVQHPKLRQYYFRSCITRENSPLHKIRNMTQSLIDFWYYYKNKGKNLVAQHVQYVEWLIPASKCSSWWYLVA